MTILEFNPKSGVGQRLIYDAFHLYGFFFRQGDSAPVLKGSRIVQKRGRHCNEQRGYFGCNSQTGSLDLGQFSKRFSVLQADCRCRAKSARGMAVAPIVSKWPETTWQSIIANSLSAMISQRASKASFDALGRWLNMDSPKNIRSIASPYTPPVSSPSSQTSIECAQPSSCRAS